MSNHNPIAAGLASAILIIIIYGYKFIKFMIQKLKEEKKIEEE